MKNRKKFLICSIFIILCIVSVTFIAVNILKSNKHTEAVTLLDKVLTKNEALEDINYMMKMLEVYHAAWLEDDSKIPELVQQQYQTEVEKLGKTVSTVELWRATASILHVMQDAHTYVNYSFGGNPYVVEDASIFKNAEIISIDKIPMEDIIETYKKYSSYESEDYPGYIFLKENLYLADGFLHLVGIDTSDGVDYEINKNGTITSYHVNMVPYTKAVNFPIPSDSNASSFVNYKIDKEKSLGVFTLTSCIVNEEYTKELNAFFSEVFDNNIQDVILDLRENSGGNSGVANQFLEYINVDKYYSFGEKYYRDGEQLVKMDCLETNMKKSQTFDGNIYVLTSVETFSAATDFAAMISDNHLGVIIGETSGNNPTCYMDSKKFQLPISTMNLYVSYKHQYRIDKSKIGKFLIPDYKVEADKALDKAYELITGNE